MRIPNMPKTTKRNKTVQHTLTKKRRKHGNAKVLLFLFVGTLTASLVWLVAVVPWWYHHSTQQTTTHQRNKNANNNPPANRHSRQTTDTTKTTTTTTTTSAIDDWKQQYYQRYGGRAAALQLYQKGIQPFGSIDTIAHRMLYKLANNQPFQLSFAGYSVTVGRGNKLSDSYPMVLKDLLQPLLSTTLGLQLHVDNAAIGGIPSFPYGFCLRHFLGAAPDLISWDYSMNERPGAANVLESYLRMAATQLEHAPMVLVLDTNKNRCQLLQQYVQQELLPNAVCVGLAKTAVPNLKETLQNKQPLPPGLQHWDEFGSPPSCPGRGSWHPKKQEHSMVAWNIAYWLVQAVEVAQSIVAKNPNWRQDYQQQQPPSISSFPPPFHTVPDNNPEAVTHLLYGHPSDTDHHEEPPRHVMPHVSCRTNFLPATNPHHNLLTDTIVSGVNMHASSADTIMTERSDQDYAAGWVLDVSKVERDTKVKVEQCGGLGYIDMKMALYGTPSSGTLRLWLPVEKEVHQLHQDHTHNDDTLASHWFDELIICEANEKRSKQACRLDADMEYTVGGVAALSPTMIAGAAEYLKRKTCVHVGIPPTATVTKLGTVQAFGGGNLSEPSRRKLAESDDQIGLVVDLQAKPHVTRSNGACCVSHVVWEQH